MAGNERPELKAAIAEIDLSETTVLVTGSTNGIGRASALAFGRLGATVLVHGRNAEAGEAVVSEIEATGGEAAFFSADLSSPDAVSALAADVQDSVSELDVLANNAGGFFPERQPTELGVDRAFHINHLSHFQLTAELLPVLATGARVVTTASLAHRGATTSLARRGATASLAHRGVALGVDTLLDLSGLSPIAAYCRSKLANIQFALELARRLDAVGRPITSNAFHPGIIPGSEFGRALPTPIVDSFELATTPVTETVEDGAATLVYLGASPTASDISGGYFARCRQIQPSNAARNRDVARKLWRHSAELLGISEPLADTDTQMTYLNDQSAQYQDRRYIHRG